MIVYSLLNSCGVPPLAQPHRWAFPFLAGVHHVIRIDIRHNIHEAAGKLAALRNELQGKAINAALKKTADKAKAEMTRQISGEFNIRAGDVRPQMTVRFDRSGGQVQVAALQAFGRRRGKRSRNVIAFAARAVPGKGKKQAFVLMPDGTWKTLMLPVGGGVSVKIKRNGPRKLIPGAFIGNKGRTVFRRTGDGRGIEPVETVDVPQMFNMKRLNKAVVTKITADFPIELNRAIAMYLSRG